MMRRLAGLGLMLLLGGCWWTGPVLYAPDPASSAPLRPGSYIEHEADAVDKRVTITRDTDGAWRAVTADGESNRFVFSPLNARMWVVEMLPKSGAAGAVFGLAWREGAALALQAIRCEGSEALTAHAGGEVRGQGANVECAFADRGSLERALRTYLGRHSTTERTARLSRVGD